MAPVIARRTVETKVGYRTRTSLFGKQILQVATKLQDWDTNSGRDDGKSYIVWLDTDEHESAEFFKTRVMRGG